MSGLSRIARWLCALLCSLAYFLIAFEHPVARFRKMGVELVFVVGFLCLL